MSSFPTQSLNFNFPQVHLICLAFQHLHSSVETNIEKIIYHTHYGGVLSKSPAVPIKREKVLSGGNVGKDQ